MSNWDLLGRSLQGPYSPQGTWSMTPVRQLPFLRVAGPVYGAYKVGSWLGQKADQRFNLSTKEANFWADRTPSPVKWFIHKHF